MTRSTCFSCFTSTISSVKAELEYESSTYRIEPNSLVRCQVYAPSPDPISFAELIPGSIQASRSHMFEDAIHVPLDLKISLPVVPALGEIQP